MWCCDLRKVWKLQTARLTFDVCDGIACLASIKVRDDPSKFPFEITAKTPATIISYVDDTYAHHLGAWLYRERFLKATAAPQWSSLKSFPEQYFYATRSSAIMAVSSHPDHFFQTT